VEYDIVTWDLSGTVGLADIRLVFVGNTIPRAGAF
jgi:hypothetical protein